MNSAESKPQPWSGIGDLPSELQRRQSHLFALNERIARLSIALRVPLERNEDVLVALLDIKGGGGGASQGAAADSAQRREHRLRAELRGLLVLRYGLAQRCVTQLGAQMTHQLMAETEVQMQREGFAPGVDGVQLDRLFVAP